MIPFEEAQRRVAAEPDFVALKRFGFSLRAVLEKHPDGCPDRLIAQALLVSEAEVEELYQKAVIKLRLIMGVDGAL